MNMNNFSHFFQYHNAIPIALGILVLGGGAAFAATNPEVIYSQEQTIVSVDNTYIANKDLSVYSPQVTITGVTEDADTYYVTYTMRTIDVDDAVWKDIDKTATMSVDKKLLGTYGDLGLYVTEQLNQNISHETDRLKEAQGIERRHVSQKTIATAYGGLIGKMLNETTETLPGYTPVVVAPAPQPEPGQLAAAAAATPANAPSGASSGAPQIDVLGNNPAHLALGTTYLDLGAVITGPTAGDRNLGIHVFLDGREVQDITLDTSTTTTYTIEYRATNGAGQVGTATRTVIVGDTPAPAETPAATPPETEAPAGEPAAEAGPVEESPTVDTPAEAPPTEAPPVEAPPAEAPAPAESEA